MNKIEKNKMILLILFITILAGTSVYLGGVFYYKSHLLPNTMVNGADFGGMNVAKAEKFYEKYSMEVIEKSDQGSEISHTLSGQEIDLKLNDISALNDIIKNQNPWKWFAKNKSEYTIDDLIEYDETKVESFVDTLDGIVNGESNKPQDAHLSDYDEEAGYRIVPEVMGSSLDREKTTDSLNKAITEMKKSLNLEEAECYEVPQVTADSETLKSSLGKVDLWIKSVVTYDFQGEEEVVDKDLIASFIDTKDGEAYLNEKQILNYLNGLRRKYDTIFSSREFATSYGKTVTVEGGDYGWWMNVDAEKTQLMNLIMNGESTKRQPEYYQTAAAYGKKDYGSSYVEINLTAQHLFVYENGEKVLESDFVSGDLGNGFNTPAGTYSLTYKEQMSELVGENYATPVSYWMPFNKNIGMHDALWRNEFGSEIYKTNGSHGCINLPYNIAKQIYSYVEKGFPVICYELAGTENGQITAQSNADIVKAVEDSIDLIDTNSGSSAKRIKFSRRLYNQLNEAQKAMVSNYDLLLNAENSKSNKSN